MYAQFRRRTEIRAVYLGTTIRQLVTFDYNWENKSLDPWNTWQCNTMKAGFMAINSAHKYESF